MRNVFLLFIVLSVHTFGQEFGFGCFGLLGGSAGYEMQNHDAAGLNSYISSYNNYYKDSLSAPLGKFQQLRGLRLGINFFRHNFSGLLLTIKAHYSTLKEKNKAIRLLSDNTKSIFNTELIVNQIGVGFDIGMPITESFNWKLFDASLLYDQAEFTTELNTSHGTLDNITYKSSGNLFTYSLGSGFILSLIKNYVSLEGSVAYVNLVLPELKAGEKKLLKTGTSNDVVGYFIKRGGINLLIQINIGLPM